MKKIIPCYYSSYGRYISRFRAIPYHIDYLKPVERRILLGLFRTAKSLVKSAKAVGYIIGELHPHGDLSAYSTIQQLVINEFVHGEGNWGSPSLDPDDDWRCAAMRYTECKLKKWVIDLAFEYINYVDWVNYEYNDEPISLPSPIPLGLIGHGINVGIAFHTNRSPRYKISDLARRLKWLLENKINEEPIIEPYIKGCMIKKGSEVECKKILEYGTGTLTIIPEGDIKDGTIRILGRVPTKTFNPLINACEPDPKTKKKEIDASLVDTSKESIDIAVVPDKKKTDLNKFAAEIWPKYIMHNINFNILTVDDNEHIQNISVDQLLINSFNFWRNAVFNKRLKQVYDQFNNKLMIIITSILKDILNNYKCNKLDEILTVWNNNKTSYPEKVILEKWDNGNWVPYEIIITKDHIEDIYNKKTIKKLVESNTDLKSADQEILDAKTHLGNLDIDCYNRVCNLI